MSNNFCTLLIIPNEKSSVKKIGISKGFLKGISFFLIFFVPILIYLFYDYIILKNDEAELALLRRETTEQQNQIENMAIQVNALAQKMEYLNQFEQKIRVMAGINVRHIKESQLGIGGPVNEEDRLKLGIATEKKAIIDAINEEMNNLVRSSASQEDKFKELFNFFQQQKMMEAARPSLWPVRGGIASMFGYRISPFTNEREFHQGIDISARFGTKVVAPSDGVVTDVSYNSYLGNAVLINHGYGIVTSLGHLSRIAVNSGARVKKGDIIGYIGNTGRSTGPHLHYSISLNGASVNPMKYLR